MVTVHSLKTYAVCDDCGKEMALGSGCTQQTVLVHGANILRLRYGSESSLPFCHDCNVAAGQVHHLGCDVERCPVCGKQLISCLEEPG